MLTIRPKQNDILATASREEFLNRMETHLRTHFPPIVETLTNEQLREVIERNWKCAEDFGLKSELGVCSYLNVVFTLGEDFEKRYKWAIPVLTNRTADEDRKLDRLRANVEAELHQTLEKEGR